MKELKQSSRRCVEVRVPASTANLGPGFDCLGMALDLYNTVSVQLMGSGQSVITAQGEGAGALPCNQSNLVVRAVELVFNHCGLSRPALRVHQNNSIPLSRGLGSSAAAVIAGLLAGRELARVDMDTNELLLLARCLEGHLDNCTAALLGGLVVTAGPPPDGRSQAVQWMRLPYPPELAVLASIPEFTLETELARQSLPDNISLEDAAFNVSHTALFVGAMVGGRLDLLRHAMQDRLHQRYRRHLIPGLEEALQAGLAAGAWGTALSGAGPTVVALVGEEYTKPVGEALQTAFEGQGIKATTLVLHPDEHGASVRIICGGGMG